MPYSSFTFTDHIGMEIFVHKWVPDENIPIKGLVCIIHGMAEHAKRYEFFAERLIKEGYICYAEDHRGHGITMLPGKHGQLGEDGWDGIILNLKQLMDQMKNDYPNKPLFIYGHSWGSHLVQDYIQKYGEMLDGAILSGTVGSQEKLGIMYTLGNLIVKIKGKDNEAGFIYNLGVKPLLKPFKASAKSPNAWISSIEEEVEKYDKDPLSGFRPTNGYFYEWSQAMKRFWNPKNEAKIPKDLPILVIGGTLDSYSNFGKKLMDLVYRYEKLNLKDFSYKFYENARHEIHNDITREEVIRDIIDFLNNRV